MIEDVAGAATVRRVSWHCVGANGAAFWPDGQTLFVVGATITAIDIAGGVRS